MELDADADPKPHVFDGVDADPEYEPGPLELPDAVSLPDILVEPGGDEHPDAGRHAYVVSLALSRADGLGLSHGNSDFVAHAHRLVRSHAHGYYLSDGLAEPVSAAHPLAECLPDAVVRRNLHSHTDGDALCDTLAVVHAHRIGEPGRDKLQDADGHGLAHAHIQSVTQSNPDAVARFDSDRLGKRHPVEDALAGLVAQQFLPAELKRSRGELTGPDYQRGGGVSLPHYERISPRVLVARCFILCVWHPRCVYECRVADGIAGPLCGSVTFCVARGQRIAVPHNIPFFVDDRCSKRLCVLCVSFPE